MIGLPGLEPASRGAWLRQCGGEALPGRTVSFDSGVRSEARALVQLWNPALVASFRPCQLCLPPGTHDLLFFSRGLVRHSIPIVRTAVQRLSPIHF